MATQDEFDAIHRDQRTTKRPRVWRKSLCPMCGATISEGMGSGQSGNFRKHVAACEKRQAEKRAKHPTETIPGLNLDPNQEIDDR